MANELNLIGSRLWPARFRYTSASFTFVTLLLVSTAVLAGCSGEPEFAVGDCVAIDDDAISDDIEGASCDGAVGTFDASQRIYRVDSIIEGLEGTCPALVGFFPVQFTSEPDNVIYCLVQADGP